MDFIRGVAKGLHARHLIRERGGETLPGVFKDEAQALAWIKSRAAL